MICGRHFPFITIASIGFLKWFTTDFLHFKVCILPKIIRHILLHRGIRGMIRGMVWPWFGHSSLSHNEHAVSHAVYCMKMPPVREYASSLICAIASYRLFHSDAQVIISYWLAEVNRCIAVKFFYAIVEFEEWLTTSNIRVGEVWNHYKINYEKLFITKDLNRPTVLLVISKTWNGTNESL